MITLANYHACNHCVIGEKTFKNILIGPGKLPGLSRNGPQELFSNRALLKFREKYAHILQKTLKLDCLVHVVLRRTAEN